jgi:hypothetical protein
VGGLRTGGTAPDRVSSSFPFTVSVTRGALQWFAGADGTQRPADPSRAYLVLDAAMAIADQSPGAVPAEYFSLTLPDGFLAAG